MIIAVTYQDGQVFQHFGHSEAFKLYQVEAGEIRSAQVVETNGSGHGALAGFLREKGVTHLICGGIGAGAPYERGVFRGAAVHFFGEQHKVVEVAACCGEHNIVAREPVGFGYLFFQIFQCCGCERNVSGGFVQVDSDSACGIVDSKAFGFDIGKVSLAGQAGLYLADCL